MNEMKEKIFKLFQALAAIVKRPYLLNLVINTEEEFRKKVLKKHKTTEVLPVLSYTKIVPSVIEISPFSYLGGSCLPTDIALLKALAMKKKAHNYFEIGTWRGESVSAIASVVDDCYTFDLSENELQNLGLSSEYIRLQGFFSSKLQNVTHLKGNSLTYDFKDYYGRFDLVFVDGDHHYSSVRFDTKTAFELIKDENSIIVWHDYANSSSKVRWEVYAAILDGCPEEAKKHIYYVSNTMCAVYMKEKIETEKYQDNPTPSHYFSVKLESKEMKE